MARELQELYPYPSVSRMPNDREEAGFTYVCFWNASFVSRLCGVLVFIVQMQSTSARNMKCRDVVSWGEVGDDAAEKADKDFLQVVAEIVTFFALFLFSRFLLVRV